MHQLARLGRPTLSQKNPPAPFLNKNKEFR
jgi:hypothetical protein